MEKYLYNYVSHSVEKIDNEEEYYYLLIEFVNGAKYISKPHLTKEKAEKEKIDKMLMQKEPFIIKKSIVIKSTEAKIFSYYDPITCSKVN